MNASNTSLNAIARACLWVGACVPLGIAQAGTLQVTPVQYAAESVTAGTAMSGAVFSYALGAPISTSSQPTFAFRFSLDKAVWRQAFISVANTYLISQDNQFSLRPDSISYLQADGSPSASVTDAATVVLNFVLRGAGGTAGPSAPAPSNTNYVFPVGSNVVIGTSAIPPQLLGTSALIAPANSCSDESADVSVSVGVFDALGQETAETSPGSPINLVKSGTYLSTAAALSVTATATGINAAHASVAETSVVDVTQPSFGLKFTPGSDNTTTTDTINIGQIVVAERRRLKDASPAAVGNNYTVEGANFGQVGPAASATDGFVSVNRLSLQINGAFQAAPSAATAASPKVFLSRLPNCLAPVNLNNGSVGSLLTAVPPMTANTVTFTNVPVVASSWPYSVVGGVKRRTQWICLQRNTLATNAEPIPTAQFNIVESSGKNTLAHDSSESGSPICGKNLLNLRANGVQFDLRNVVAKNSPAYEEGWRSFVRFINTDETQTANIAGQVITSEGVLLAGKQLLSLAPRAYKFMSTDEIEANLIGSVSAAYAATDGQNYRLRLSAPVASLRAQNYLFNPNTKNYMEASGTQGDESPGTTSGRDSVAEDRRK